MSGDEAPAPKRARTNGVEKPLQLGKAKVFNDPVHGHIELHPLCCKVMDTPTFQRLRDLKQLGGVYHVFAGASHNRFEHSIGVAYLAQRFVCELAQRQPELGISAVDAICVSLAGLCHDLGHGPYSHMFDRLFIPKAVAGCTWEHEMASVALLEHLIEANGLQSEFEKHGVMEDDLVFIKEIILGVPWVGPHTHPASPVKKRAGMWPYKGRGKDKAFLYEIVANKRNGIDVDKWDYFKRDCHMLGMKCSFDPLRLMRFARVISVDAEAQLCFHEKETWNIYEMFHTRYSLHRRAYQHRVSRILEYMLVEALLLAEPVLRIRGKDGIQLKMSETITDPTAYEQMTDHVFRLIQYSTEPALAPARDMLKRVLARDLYPFVGETLLPNLAIKQDRLIIEMLAGSELEHDKDIVIQLIKISYGGMGDANPVDNVRFFSRRHNDRAGRMSKDKVSSFIPQVFSERYVRVYCKNPDKFDACEAVFDKWVEGHGLKRTLIELVDDE